MAFGIFAVFLWLKSPREAGYTFDRLRVFVEANQETFAIATASVVVNLFWIGITGRKLARFVGFGASFQTFNREKKRTLSYIGITAVLLFITVGASWICSRHLPLRNCSLLLPFGLTPKTWIWWLTGSISLSLLGAELAIWSLGSRLKQWFAIDLSLFYGLPRVPVIRDGIILGAICENEDHDIPKADCDHERPSWIILGLKALTGNIFISGAIGSGKSQFLLRILKQILQNFSTTPAMLAIDPKRTFVRELRKIIELLGLSDRLLWVSLDGNVKFNPIWREGMLKGSTFTTIANSLRLASINFLGSSSENRFWEQSSFNLLKNSLIYCTAKYDYFTFKELYRALILARDEGLATELVDCLNNKSWDEEERSNIEMAIDYFKDEFSQMDQKIRTSILATATGFLNEFLEYRVSQILSPRREEISLHSMKVAIREGKLICLYIENDALARSIGTLFKLLFQEAVLERVNDAGHESSPYAVLVKDEYQDVVTSGGGAGLGDDRFLAKGRESKAITIAATQGVSSLENSVRSEPATREILQNFRTRVFSNSTDPKTIRLFQDPNGQEEKERKSHSLSESAQDAKADLFFGGFNSKKSSMSEGVSTHYSMEYPITAREFARLKPFEAYAQIFNGIETHFEKLFIKPYFLKSMRTSHRKIINQMRDAARVQKVKLAVWFVSILLSNLLSVSDLKAGAIFPNVCSALKSNSVDTCLSFKVSACMCGYPIPRPCAQVSYYVPVTFLEVWPESKDTFFSSHPAGAYLRLRRPLVPIPFGAEDEQGSFSFQARAIAVPLAGVTFNSLLCGGARMDKPCFDLMSEDIGRSWNEGSADKLQPNFLAWMISPKACLLKGAATGFAGGGVTPSLGPDTSGCSYPMGFIPLYPPSPREACNGWGTFYPRSGIYQGASRNAAALMIASRLKSIGTEIAHTVPGDLNEVWQMLYPQSSSCFKEGQNLGILETVRGVREEQRIFGKPIGYLFLVWKQVSCCQDIPQVAAGWLELEALKLACQVRTRRDLK